MQGQLFSSYVVKTIFLKFRCEIYETKQLTLPCPSHLNRRIYLIQRLWSILTFIYLQIGKDYCRIANNFEAQKNKIACSENQNETNL